jgi:hypothetical protein
VLTIIPSNTCNDDKETATMTSEAASIPEPPNVFIYNKETKEAPIPNNITHVKVDPSVKEIRAWAFDECLSLVEIEFSEGLEVIGVHAFYKCRNLKFINKLPSTLKEIRNRAFRYCASLDSIEFPKGLQVIGKSAFRGCGELKTIKIPSAHVMIGEWAFSECCGLVSVDLPEGIQGIGSYWFGYCTSLTTVNVPSSVKKIQDSAFAGCRRLASLDLPEGLQFIGPGSFAMCKSLATLHIPSTVCKMGYCVFWECTGLRSITLPDALETIEARMFCNCDSLTHIKIPPKIKKIGEGAFQGCEGLKHLRIPSSVVEIGALAFASCRQLLSVNLLGNFLHTIEKGAFYDCSSLTHARIPPSVTRIESGAFANCTQLISLELPEGLETISLDVEHDPDFPEERLEMIDPDGPEISSIYCCKSLVNLVIPSEQDFEQPRDVALFMNGLKLRHVATNFTDLVSKLQNRFDDLPVHRLCYYQSYHLLTETMENLRRSMDADPGAGTNVDAFGMTLFHILALSQTPNLSLFQALMKVCKVDIIHSRDTFGSNPIDYLCVNRTPASVLVIRSLLPPIFAERVRWLGLVRWKSDMVASINEALEAEFSSRRSAFGMLCFKLTTYERLESVSLLELALWKVKIESCKAAYETDYQWNEASSRPESPRLNKAHLDGVDRQSCRINSGADAVISNVLPFLDKVVPYCCVDTGLHAPVDNSTVPVLVL